MKKFLLLLTLLPLFASAQYTSDMLVYNPFNEAFTVYINNVAINQSPTNKLIINELQPGNYLITIGFANTNLQPVTQNIYIQVNALTSIKLIKNGYYYTLDITNPIYYNTVNYNPDDPNIHPVPPTPQPPQTEPEPPQQTSNGYCDYPMADAEFANALNSIKNQDFESSRLTVAKQVANSNCLTANQVRQIIAQFDFESTKLEFAKFAYTHTYDPENYYTVNDEFSFSSSIDDLNSYIDSLD